MMKIRDKVCATFSKRYRFAHVFEAADPGDDALNPHTEAAMGHAAVLAQVQIPSESLFWQAVLVNSLDKQIVRGMRCEPPMISP